jgi:hypothetical protein
MAESPENLEELTKVLEYASDRSELEAAAVALATSDNPAALDRLGDFLRRREFLAKLDDLEDPHTKMLHLNGVMKPLEKRPSSEAAGLCLALGHDPNFLEDSDRMDFLLLAIAAAKPMDEAAVGFFRETNEQGYFAFNAPLLAKNGSPRALALFEEMMQDGNVPAARRVDCLHSSVLPIRTSLPVLQSCERLMARDLEEEVAIGLIESIFDFQGKKWFGPHPPIPPGWRTASPEVLQLVLRLAQSARARSDLPPSLQVAIDETVQNIHGLLARRSP